MILSSEDIEFIRFSKDCLNKGRYSDISRLTEVYNRCFADRVNFKPVQNTQCSSCVRHRICELYSEMIAVLGKMEKKEDVNS